MKSKDTQLLEEAYTKINEADMSTPRPTPETDEARHDLSDYGSPVPCSYGDWVPFEVAEKLERERDEARELCRELIDLVAYGLGQSGQEWSLDAMRQARETIQKAKALEAK